MARQHRCQAQRVSGSANDVGTESARPALRLRLLSLQLGVGDSFLGGIQTFWAALSSWNEVVSMYIEGQDLGRSSSVVKVRVAEVMG